MPGKFLEHLSNTGSGPVVMGSPPGRSTLNRCHILSFLCQCRCGETRGGVFQLWSYKCFVCCGSKVLVMNFDVAFEKAQRLICFFGDVIYVISPAEVFRYCDPKVLGSGYTFKFNVV